MWTLTAPNPTRFCDGISRRALLRIGSLGLGGLTLADLLRLEANAGNPPHPRTGSRHKSVILVYLSGGLSHIDTFDLKPLAPAEIRGEFRGIDSRLPGVPVCEHLPLLASQMHRIALIRSLVGQRDEHSSFQSLTGTTMDAAQREGRPHLGSVVAKIAGPVDPVVPPFIDLFPVMQHRPYNTPGPGHLGLAAAPARLASDELALVRPAPELRGKFPARRKLLADLDAARADLDRAADAAIDPFQARAFELLASDKVARALDVEREDPRLRARYGYGSGRHLGDGAPLWNDQLLAARRLVEAGARVVTIAYGFWDTHGGNFAHLKKYLPVLDQGLAALIDDLHARGLDHDCTLLVWGEFGRTPRINKDAGRDHWAPVNMALLAGGGLNVGQVIGSTDKSAAYANASPIPYADVLATVYHALGIDPHGFVQDRTGRPIPVLPASTRPIDALIL
jgi:hypothetical protein